MRKVGSKIEDVIALIQNLKGQDVDLEINRGRKKTVQISGFIESTYPSIFTIRCKDEKKLSYSYSYADVLCGTVSLFCKEDKQEADEKSAG